MVLEKLKQRIVGLLVLGALAAIIIPILLDISQSNQSVAVSPIPDKPEGFIVKRLSLDTPQERAVLSDIPKLVKQNKTSDAIEPVEIQKDSEPSVAVVEVKQSLEKPQAWVVQLASFSKEKNALALRNQLQKSGYRASIERIVIGEERKFRIKVGPEQSKEVANNLQVELLDKFKLKGVVIKHRLGASIVTKGG